jgi:hypothetical protein
MTQSQTLFEKFCSDSGIKCVHIQTEKTKTPDYELTIDGQKVIVEVKEIIRNKDEQEYDRLIKERGIAGGTNTPGDRVREKIRKASPQIKMLTRGIKPSILVLLDRGLIAGHLEPYNIRVAMYGLEQVHINVPRNPSISPYATGMSYGPKRKMTDNHNTSISAIGGLLTLVPNEIILYVYHNKYAAVPLDPKLLAKYGIRQFVLEDEVPGKTAKWKELSVKDDLIYMLPYER